MEDDNEIIIEDDIVKAISFNGGISGTTGKWFCFTIINYVHFQYEH